MLKFIKVCIIKYNMCTFAKQNTETMKSLLFKSAWSIFKMENVSFSVALKMAWEAIKNGQKVVIEKLNRLVKSAGLGYETIYFYKLTYTNIETSKSVYSNDGASSCYDGKTFNND